MQPGLIDRNRHKWQPCLQALLLELQDCLQHIEIQLDHKAIALKKFNEAPWHQKAQLWAAPAHQCLRSDAGLGPDIVFRLIPYFEFPTRQGCLHAALQLLVKVHMLL